MVRNICTDLMILSQKASPVTKDDLPAAIDLQETLKANAYRCVGMAANMIGIPKAIIAVQVQGISFVMLNPTVTAKLGRAYKTEEGCLCHKGERPVTRYETVEVSYQDLTMKKQKRRFSGYVAQIIQHEMDHLSGILI